MKKTIKNLKTINYALRNAYEKEKEVSNKERDEKLKERDEKLKERDEKLMWKAKYEELLKKFESVKGENMGDEENRKKGNYEKDTIKIFGQEELKSKKENGENEDKKEAEKEDKEKEKESKNKNEKNQKNKMKEDSH